MKTRLTASAMCALAFASLFALNVFAAPHEKIGVIMHDHGAPRTHNAESYYGMKYFLDELVNMEVIPAFVRDGFVFDPFQGNWGVILMDKNRPYEEVPWADLELIDAWGNDMSWLKAVDANPATPAIDPVYKWKAAGTDMYGNRGHYRLSATPYRTMFPTLPGWDEQDFFEFGGFDFYASWMKKGGIEVYFDQVEEQRNAVRDALWAKYGKTLTGHADADDETMDGMPFEKEHFIVLTHGIDNEFMNTDPAASRHAQSLYDAVTMLVMDMGVKKLVINEYFMFLSQMMNDEMDRMTVMDALMDLDMMGYGGIEVIWAPDKQPIGDVTVPVYACTQWPPQVQQVGTETRTAYVGGVAFNGTFLNEVTRKAKRELDNVPKSSGDVAFFLSNHGAATTTSFCFDSANDYIHYSYKAFFVQAASAIGKKLKAKKIEFGPDALSVREIRNPFTVETLSKNIQYATAVLNDGRVLKFFRTAGQSAGAAEDPGGLSYSPREALDEITAANASGANFTNVVDLLYNFFGDSGDLLIDHRLDGYGHGNETDPLYLAAWTYCNPYVPSGDVHDCSLPEYAGLEPYETEFDWSGVHVRITNATWGFEAKEQAVFDFISEGIKMAAH